MTKFRFINSDITSAVFAGEVLSYTRDGITKTVPRRSVTLLAANEAPDGYAESVADMAKCRPLPVILSFNDESHNAAMCLKDYEAGVYILRQGVVIGSDSKVSRGASALQRGINAVASICGGCTK